MSAYIGPLPRDEFFAHAAACGASQSHIANSIRRFFASFEVEGDCWRWTGKSFGENRYGAIGLGRKCLGAHRVSYLIHKGAIAAGLYVCHSCDNKWCVNPDHLWLGSLQDNNRDRHIKGRTLRGEACARHILTSEQARIIKNTPKVPGVGKALARRFNVKESAVSAIRLGRSWTHV